MMLNILKDKRAWIGLAIALLFAIGIISAIHVINQSKQEDNSEKDTVKTETDKDKDANKDENKPYNGEGMEVVEDDKVSEDSMEVPESWDSTSENEDSGKEDNKQQEENDEEEKKEPSENTLTDDTTSWGDIF